MTYTSIHKTETLLVGNVFLVGTVGEENHPGQGRRLNPDVKRDVSRSRCEVSVYNVRQVINRVVANSRTSASMRESSGSDPTVALRDNAKREQACR